MVSYLHFLRGDDDSVDVVDREVLEKLQQLRGSMEESVKDLEGKLLARKEPSARELVDQKERSVLEEKDVKKVRAMIRQLNGHVVMVEN